MKNEAEQIEQLQKVRDAIADDDNAFSMGQVRWGHYTVAPPDSHKGECDTPACIKGWAEYFKYRDLFDEVFSENSIFTYSERDSITEPEITLPAWHPDYNDFSLSGNNLVTWHSHETWFTRSRTVAMLDHLLYNLREHNKVVIDWLIQERAEYEKSSSTNEKS